MTERIVEPEWLDELPADEPRAIESRRDLRRLNGLLSHAHIMARALGPFPAPKRVLDLGAGDGSFALRLAQAANWQNTEFVLLDRAPIPSSVAESLRSLNCQVTLVQQDALEDYAAVDCIVTNLFLHHFAESELRRLLRLAASRCRTFVACEPRRSLFALVASRLVGIIGCNSVTRHDAVASVRAGFRDSELSAHWPCHAEWSLAERRAGLFSQLFLARKL